MLSLSILNFFSSLLVPSFPPSRGLFQSNCAILPTSVCPLSHLFVSFFSPSCGLLPTSFSPPFHLLVLFPTSLWLPCLLIIRNSVRPLSYLLVDSMFCSSFPPPCALLPTSPPPCGLFPTSSSPSQHTLIYNPWECLRGLCTWHRGSLLSSEFKSGRVLIRLNLSSYYSLVSFPALPRLKNCPFAQLALSAFVRSSHLPCCFRSLVT